MPDLSILVELADYYDADIREIINGERKSGKMEEELKDTLERVAEYSQVEKKDMKRKMTSISVTAAVLLLAAVTLLETNGFGGFIPETWNITIAEYAFGAVLGILGLNVLYLAGLFEKIDNFKRKRAAKDN